MSSQPEAPVAAAPAGEPPNPPGWRARLASPYGVMWLVVAMYLVKVTVKLSAGYLTNSPVFISDGYHNLSDILQAFAVMLVVFMARRPPSADYPLGKSNVEFCSSLVIGMGMLWLGWQFAVESGVGLLHQFPAVEQLVRDRLSFLPAHAPLRADAASYPWLIGIMAASGLVSAIVSRHQIAVGRRTGHASLVADGRETASDGRIELIAMAGVTGQFVFNAPWLEYPLALLVAGLVVRTGCELSAQAFRALLQHSLPQDVEGHIRAITMDVAGVDEIDSLKTFQVGQVAVCLLTVRTRLGAEKVAFVRLGVEQRLRDFLEQAGFISSEIHLNFRAATVDRRRIAFALSPSGGGLVVAPALESADHLAICDVEDGRIARARLYVKPDRPAAFLQDKLVGRLFLFTPPPEPPDRPQLLAAASGEPVIPIEQSTVLDPGLLPLEG